eukprot:scaffold74295_cov43-Phaeocystis_antarctica.AAC.2
MPITSSRALTSTPLTASDRHGSSVHPIGCCNLVKSSLNHTTTEPALNAEPPSAPRRPLGEP